jgi:hypothetical protein
MVSRFQIIRYLHWFTFDSSGYYLYAFVAQSSQSCVFRSIIRTTLFAGGNHA